MIPFLFGLFLGVGAHHLWVELQMRREMRWFAGHQGEVEMYLRTMARRN